MTPRTRMRTVRESAPVLAVIEATRASGHSRFPVIGDDDDADWCTSRRRSPAQSDRSSTRVRDVMSTPVVVTRFMRLDPLMDLLQDRGCSSPWWSMSTAAQRGS